MICKVKNIHTGSRFFHFEMDDTTFIPPIGNRHWFFFSGKLASHEFARAAGHQIFQLREGCAAAQFLGIAWWFESDNFFFVWQVCVIILT